MANDITSKIFIERQHLEHGCDGPLTPFVLISRAVRSASNGGDREVVANALYESLEELFGLTDGTIETGS